MYSAISVVVAHMAILAMYSPAYGCLPHPLQQLSKGAVPQTCRDFTKLDIDISDTVTRPNLRRHFHAATGLFILTEKSHPQPSLVEDINEIWQLAFDGRPNALSKLKYLYFLDHNTPAFAYYVEPKDAIALNSYKLQQHNDTFNILAHEVGHAFVFSMLTPEQLAQMAHRFGSWPKPDRLIKSFYHHSLTSSFHGQNTMAFAFPSTYSYRNTHEWFAEVFAKFIDEKRANHLKSETSHMIQRLINP